MDFIPRRSKPLSVAFLFWFFHRVHNKCTVLVHCLFTCVEAAPDGSAVAANSFSSSASSASFSDITVLMPYFSTPLSRCQFFLSNENPGLMVSALWGLIVLDRVQAAEGTAWLMAGGGGVLPPRLGTAWTGESARHRAGKMPSSSSRSLVSSLGRFDAKRKHHTHSPPCSIKDEKFQLHYENAA